jgi:hypothetical protein
MFGRTIASLSKIPFFTLPAAGRSPDFFDWMA